MIGEVEPRPVRPHAAPRIGPISRRAAGLLLHPTSLPGPFGIGDLGRTAHVFVDFLASAGIKLWQVLPLGPTGYGDSPYQLFSAFAGNPLLISLEVLVDDGLLGREDLASVPSFPAHRVDFGAVIAFKQPLLRRAWERFAGGAAPHLSDEFKAYRRAHRRWLDDYAFFMALKDANGGAMWNAWDRPLARREPQALAKARRAHAKDIAAHRFRQFLFDRQWSALREHAHAAGIRIVGDIPIYVAFDSADVWAHPELYQLGDDFEPTVVAGVPPDYFSATGQLWGNPIYRWDALEATRFAWWVERFRSTLARVDIVRLDHFRGFEAYWEVPAGMPTAERGRWVKAPGDKLLATLRRRLGALPVIAEDLGVITPEVIALRDRFKLPGMVILQFAFATDGQDPSLPHNLPRNRVIYSGTHDNDTTRGWYESSSTEAERTFARRYVATDGTHIAWDLIRMAFASVADTAIVPVQDVLELGTDARMNLPGRPGGNWGWRCPPGALNPEIAMQLAEWVTFYGR
ncbi:MAG TPA: 4-alpha-glucanotransferase [Candidatus Limnocylindria bacterium]|nr:4-alpha-glucanotransferase [Candidatus Limnocylindria bacterium]